MPPRLDNTKPPATPELDRRSDVMHSLRHPHDVLTEFYDWLREQGLQLCTYETRPMQEVCPGPPMFDMRECKQGKVRVQGRISSRTEELWEDCPRCKGTGYITVQHEDWWVDNRQPERLFLDFFGLDQDKIDTEQRELLAYLRTRPQG
jgi:hypothetical protein